MTTALTTAQWLVLARFALMLVEMALIRAHLVRGRYTLRDTLASIGMRAGNYATNVLLAGATVAVFTVIYEHRLFDIPMTAAWAWVALVVLDDFAYYWFHRISHECRFWWAAHVNHHSSQEYNLSTALRQPWTGVLVGTWAPWFVLSLLGFPTEMIFLQSGLNLLYQFWIHTEAIRRLPPWFEYLFNTPSQPPRAPRLESALRRPQLRRHLHGLGPPVRHVRGRTRRRSAEVRPDQQHQHVQPDQDRVPRVGGDVPRPAPGTQPARGRGLRLRPAGLEAGRYRTHGCQRAGTVAGHGLGHRA